MWQSITLAVAAVGLAATTAPRAPVHGAAPEIAEYTFARPLVGGLGVTSLADLRGKPVFIDFWGTR